jgi:predicted dithiol-disulfide oxidoreductase (DUF899 family)
MSFRGWRSQSGEGTATLARKDDHRRRQVSDATTGPALIGVGGTVGAPVPAVVDRETWQKHLNVLLVREKALTREGDAIAAVRRRLPMVEVDAATTVVGRDGPVSLLDVFEGRRQLVVYYHMWHKGQPAPLQCEGCSFFNGHVREFSYLHSRDVTYAAFCEGPYAESARYHDFMGWEMPWYSAEESREVLTAGRGFGLICCYLCDGDRVFETYWTTGRAAERMSNTYAMLDMTIYGRQETWEDSPPGWPQSGTVQGEQFRYRGRPTAQWARLASGHSDDLSVNPGDD